MVRILYMFHLGSQQMLESHRILEFMENLNITSLVRVEHFQSHVQRTAIGWLLFLSKLKKLQQLDLGSNFFSGTLPVEMGLLSSLRTLDLSNNKLQGSIPHSLGNLSSLVELSLGDNHLTGSIPQEISKLENLERLDISNNSLSGDFFFSSHLDRVDLSHNSGLVILQGSDFNPSFQLSELQLSYCDMSKFDICTSFLSTQHSFEVIYFSYAKLSGTIPPWLPQLYGFGFSYNNFSGEKPKNFSIHFRDLDISHNFLTGDIASILSSFNVPRFNSLDMSFNKFYGRLPSNMTGNFLSLDLSNNNISGNLPLNLTRAWTWQSENFYLSSIQSIHLEHNAFHGTIPENLLLYSPFLMVMDIGTNCMSGLIPSEIAEISHLQVLILKEKRFERNIPDEICRLQQLAILDLSENNFEGSIPSFFHKNSAWVNGCRSTIRASWDSHVGLESEYVEVVNFKKGNEYGYSGIVLSVITGIELSLNHLSGPIPMEIGLLKGLIVLNISKNLLNGTIPDSFSEFQFSVVYNDLESAVPIVNNFQTFEEKCSGNPKLCGYPRKKCTQLEEEDKENEEKISIWVGYKPVLYACIATGFIVGFWGVL
ncbi:hypothetical protein AMTRI_Chr04g243420 [Amborella trichopoda]